MAEDWSPKDRDEWVGLFRDGILAADTQRAEDAAKAAAQQQQTDPPDKKPEDAKPSFRQRLLGL